MRPNKMPAITMIPTKAATIVGLNITEVQFLKAKDKAEFTSKNSSPLNCSKVILLTAVPNIRIKNMKENNPIIQISHEYQAEKFPGNGKSLYSVHI